MFRPWLTLKHAGIEIDEVTIDLDRPDTEQRIGAYSPTGRVPVLLVDVARVCESLAICEWAAERVLDQRLWPIDAAARAEAARAEARAIAYEMHAGFSVLRETLPFDTASTRSRPAVTQELTAEIARILSIWNSRRSRYGGESEDEGFQFGRLSIADAMYAPSGFALHHLWNRGGWRCRRLRKGDLGLARVRRVARGRAPGAITSALKPSISASFQDRRKTVRRQDGAES